MERKRNGKPLRSTLIPHMKSLCTGVQRDQSVKLSMQYYIPQIHKRERSKDEDGLRLGQYCKGRIAYSLLVNMVLRSDSYIFILIFIFFVRSFVRCLNGSSMDSLEWFSPRGQNRQIMTMHLSSNRWLMRWLY